ncbi:hypothetical protein MNEG_4446 [Monoraphidium neglectum]|uniref:J domain-containing protein n=1 Tax=Monoraphidium neglectum TaxID=145388 RepID=A0A0D2NE39_9CHLO|nr:hypothetical protein MNEG_4446 [Monoraphidium neglectum]KIZ03516.1 hypothetical protein MNEG_4446 [Monoraphidium neglectum]|eukprot:XP_013902535.1 hypothetical protein MNEG_4446 [Monoraphidium neglectum]
MAAAPPQVQEADLMPLAEALKLLGLQEGASQEQIRAAYKARLLRLHPDKQQAARAKRSATAPSQNTPTGDSATGGGSGSGEAAAAAAFHRLQAAYRALTAPPPEQRFDALVANGRAFSREVLDEALRQGLGPADVAAM